MAKPTTTKPLPKEGVEAGRELRAAAAKEERNVEAEKGSDLKKGAERFEERAESANGSGAKKTQTPKKQ